MEGQVSVLVDNGIEALGSCYEKPQVVELGTVADLTWEGSPASEFNVQTGN